MLPCQTSAVLRLPALIAGMLYLSAAVNFAAPDPGLKSEVDELRRANSALMEQLRQQQVLIEQLTGKVDRLATDRKAEHGELEELKSTVEDIPPVRSSSAIKFGNVIVSGEGAVGFFDGQGKGMLRNSELRVDEAKLFIEAPVWEETYFYTELNLAARESPELELYVGEFYLDFENVSRLWDRDRQVNLRIGRLDVPFGEEYLYRDAIDDPLVTHSLSDIWGVDEGAELYGSFGRFSYVVAVQNGGVPANRDFNADKSVAGRISYDPAPWLHLSVSAMRTGDLDVNEDEFSEVWFGYAWFRSIGSTNTTTFNAHLVEGDVSVHWRNGQLRTLAGWAFYDDNDPGVDNSRDIYFGSVEVVQSVTRKLYTATRLSCIRANDGYALRAHGDAGRYFFNPSPILTETLWRLGLGLGYRFNDNLVVKTEYTFNRGTELGGVKRDQEDFFALQAAMKF